MKIGYKGEIHRVRVELQELNFATLENLFHDTFGLQEAQYVIQYFNVDQTRHVVRDQTSLEKCLAMHGSQETSLKFLAQSKHSAALYDVTEPILKALEKLMVQLQEAMRKLKEKAKEEDWEGKCRRSMEATGEAIQLAAKDARDSIYKCKEEVEGFPYSEVLEDTTETIKKAARDISVFAQQIAEDVAKEFRGDKAPSPVATETTLVTEEENSSEVSQESVPSDVPAPKIVVSAQPSNSNEVQATEDGEWNVVAEQEAEVSKDIVEWKTQLDMIREFFPECDLKSTCELLQRYKGEVNVVLNALAEM